MTARSSQRWESVDRCLYICAYNYVSKPLYAVAEFVPPQIHPEDAIAVGKYRLNV